MSYGSRNAEMPYLDSFVKETARLSPGPTGKPAALWCVQEKIKEETQMLCTDGQSRNTVSAPRTVMVPYTSPNGGYYIPTDNWVAIPQLPLMRGPSIWPRALALEGFRFVKGEEGTSGSRLTHPSHEFPFWGSTRYAW